MSANTYAGFKGGFLAVHERLPTGQEIWNAAVASGIRRSTDGTAEQASEREGFEKQMRKCGHMDFTQKDGRYWSLVLNEHWVTWKAARASRPSLPPFIRREVEEAIQAAEHPKGMSVHDGKAKVLAPSLRYMLTLIDGEKK